ncbi:unnamed protein product [Gordionus sp. m RMFG-2023]
MLRKSNTLNLKSLLLVIITMVPPHSCRFLIKFILKNNQYNLIHMPWCQIQRNSSDCQIGYNVVDLKCNKYIKTVSKLKLIGELAIVKNPVNLIVSANGATLEKRDNGMSVMTPQKCPPVCMIYCEFGNVLDANGCPTCQCKPNPNCPPVCAIYCQFGNVMDASGCKTCQCNPAPSNLASLPDTTLQGGRSGLVSNADSNAVTAVDMTALRCPPVCRIYCQFGNVLDVNSCPICQCNPNPNCPPVCHIYCQFGNVIDANGCPICKCDRRPSNLASLPDTLQGGRSGLFSNAFTAVDKTAQKCPAVCEMLCLFGNVLDANGCPICKCNPRPSNLASLPDTSQGARSGIVPVIDTAVDTTVRNSIPRPRGRPCFIQYDCFICPLTDYATCQICRGCP